MSLREVIYRFPKRNNIFYVLGLGLEACEDVVCYDCLSGGKLYRFRENGYDSVASFEKTERDIMLSVVSSEGGCFPERIRCLAGAWGGVRD